MKNNRNTMLLISGIGQIVKSIVSAVVLLLVSLSIEIIDVTLKLNIFNTALYKYSPQLGEKLITIIIVFIFVYLSISMFMSFAAGLICIDQSKVGNNPLTSRRTIIAISVVNIAIFNSLIFSAIALISLILDKRQPDSYDEEVKDDHLKAKIDELKKLKEEKVISQKEFLDMLTNILVE